MLRSKSICNKIRFFFHSYFLFSKLWVICKRHKLNMNWYKKQRYKSPYIKKDIHVYQMKTAHIVSVVNRQSRRCCVGIPMDISNIMNVTFVQRRIFYADIIMDISTMINVVTTQRHRYCAGITMDEFRNMNVLISQLGTSCAFDSPGLARNEPTLGKRSQGDSTP